MLIALSLFILPQDNQQREIRMRILQLLHMTTSLIIRYNELKVEEYSWSIDLRKQVDEFYVSQLLEK